MLSAVKAADYDRYLALLYAPADRRADLAVLYAFNAEVAAIRDRVRDALPGEVRLQWWRDAIGDASSRQATGHPVADALIATIERNGLPKVAFENYLEARVFDLYNDPMPSRTDLEGYCGETAGALLQLSSLILDSKAAPAAAEVAGRAGCAQAIVGLLRLLPLHRSRGQCFVPADILAASGSSPQAFLTAGAAPENLAAIEAMRALAYEHFAAFRAGAKQLPEQLRPAFLPLAISATDLARLADPRAVFDGVRDLSPLRKQWIVMARALRGWR